MKSVFFLSLLGSFAFGAEWVNISDPVTTMKPAFKFARRK